MRQPMHKCKMLEFVNNLCPHDPNKILKFTPQCKFHCRNNLRDLSILSQDKTRTVNLALHRSLFTEEPLESNNVKTFKHNLKNYYLNE